MHHTPSYPLPPITPENRESFWKELRANSKPIDKDVFFKDIQARREEHKKQTKK
jgi:hypothetical protein